MLSLTKLKLLGREVETEGNCGATKELKINLEKVLANLLSALSSILVYVV